MRHEKANPRSHASRIGYESEPYRFPHMPTEKEMEKIQERLKNTGIPELDPAISLSPPDPDKNHYIVGKIDIPQKIRSWNEPAFCAICQTWKFYEGRLIYCTDDMLLRPIGHKCAAKHFGYDRYNHMHKEFIDRERYKENEEFLLSEIPNVDVYLNEIYKFIETAYCADCTKNDLRKNAGELVNEFLGVLDKDGSLHVYRQARSIDEGPAGLRTSSAGAPDSGTEIKPERVGTVTGARFLAYKARFSKEIEKINKGLSPFGGCQNAFDAIDLVPDDPTARERAAKELKRLIEKKNEICEILAKSRSFFSVGNFATVANWINDKDSPVDSKAEFFGSKLIIRGPDNEIAILKSNRCF